MLCVEIARISGSGEAKKVGNDEHGRCAAAGSELLHRRQEARVCYCSFTVSWSSIIQGEDSCCLAAWSGWMGRPAPRGGGFWLPFPGVVRGRLGDRAPPGWPLWRTTYLCTTSPMRMPSKWPWISRCGDYWQQAKHWWCMPNNDDDDVCLVYIIVKRRCFSSQTNFSFCTVRLILVRVLYRFSFIIKLVFRYI